MAPVTPSLSAIDQHNLRRIAGLDGVRGLAILLVSMLHLVSSEKSWLTQHVAGSGWIGVDLFFVLSGFLITRILLGSVGSSHFFGRFYARRALRIWPLYYSVLAFAFIVTRALPAPMHISVSLLPFYATFTQNLFMPKTFGPWALSGTWSLAIEEQFYLLWPFLVQRLQRPTLMRLLLCIVLATLAARVIVLELGATPCSVYISSLLHSDGLAAGSLAAISLDSSARTRLLGLARSIGLAALLFGLILSLTIASHRLVTSTSAVGPLDACMISVTYSFLAIGFAALILQVAVDGAWGKAFAHPLLTFFGRISFGLYLLQGIMIPMSQALLRPWLTARLGISGMRITALVVGVAALGSLALALLSWRFLEAPALALRKHLSVKPLTGNG